MSTPTSIAEEAQELMLVLNMLSKHTLLGRSQCSWMQTMSNQSHRSDTTAMLILHERQL